MAEEQSLTLAGQTVDSFASAEEVLDHAGPGFNGVVLSEIRMPGMEVSIWHGIYAPKGTPAEATERLSAAMQKAVADQDIIAKFAELGTAPSSAADATPAALKAKLETEIGRWKPVIETAGVYAD